MDGYGVPARQLSELIFAYEGSSFYDDVLAPRSEEFASERTWLSEFSARPGSPWPSADDENLWRLYGLGRVNELLLLGFQPPKAGGLHWTGPRISEEQYASFAASLGLALHQVRAFSPFYHEIVEVEAAKNDDEPIQLLASLWPCLMAGNMLFSRAGVRVSAGRSRLRRELAESSTLYWAYRRQNRPYCDLSRGWGSNSQWRTKFRRDYRLGGEFYFNVDGTHDLASPSLKVDADLTRQERVELLTYRCFVVTGKPHDDLFPYKDFLARQAEQE